MVKAAHRVIYDVLQGNPREEIHKQILPDGTEVETVKKIYPNFRAQIAVAQMVFDRIEPKKREQFARTLI
jgi:hypothetical protein